MYADILSHQREQTLHPLTEHSGNETLHNKCLEDVSILQNLNYVPKVGHLKGVTDVTCFVGGFQVSFPPLHLQSRGLVVGSSIAIRPSRSKHQGLRECVLC